MGYPFVMGDSVRVEIDDTPCALSEISDLLSGAGIMVKSCCVVDRSNGRATWALSVDDEDGAKEALGQAAVGDLTSAAN